MTEAENTDNYSMVTEVEQCRKALTVENLAKILNCSKRSVYNMIDAKILPAYQIGTMIRLDPKSTALWLKSRSTMN